MSLGTPGRARPHDVASTARRIRVLSRTPGYLASILVVALTACSSVDTAMLEPPPGDGDASGDGGLPTGGGDGDGDGDLAQAGMPGDKVPPDAGTDACRVDLPCDEACTELCNGNDDDCDGLVDEGTDDTDCAADHATTACLHGVCIVTVCEEDFQDCDGDADTGCEVDLNTTDNCGACFNVCSFDNAMAGCAQGVCYPNGCAPGYLNCDGAPERCETPAGTLDDCTACGDACGAVDNASPGCGPDGCGVGECIGNFGDCNGVGADGCELELTELDNCGRCGAGCSFSGSVSTCASGVCIATDCEDGYANCDGDGTDGCESLDSVEHCGGCGQVCTVQSMQNVIDASCESRVCVAECAPGFGDCDGEPNGCETPLTTANNCGACGQPCAPPHATGGCGDGSCSVFACQPGWADCDGEVDNGCEQNLDDPTACGSCDTQCPPMIGCSAGQCRGITCPEGQADCDGVDSCDYDLSSDATCGACNVGCAFDDGVDGHGTVACAVVDPMPGQMDWACEVSCDDGFADCDGDYHNGCEVDLTSLDNCGGCGQVCAKQHATPTCENRACEVDLCNVDWGDCDGDGLSCERQLDTSSNCGACNNTCMLDNAESVCTGSPGARSCAVGACNPAFYRNCDGNPVNGCETDTRLDPQNCNSCDNDCGAQPHAGMVSCELSACVFDSCAAGYADCNAGPGCESDLTADATCGSCGNDCADLPHTSAASCNPGGGSPFCEVVTCAVGHGDCGPGAGCETDVLTSNAHCGACSGDVGHVPCENLPNVAASTCSGGSCYVATCDPGYEDCNADPTDGCEWQPAIDGECCDAAADTDGDGLDDCADECPLDADRHTAGGCGCPSSPTAGGTACNDGLCAANTQCDGAGNCGTPGDCDTPSGSCTFRSYPGMTASGYWFCTDGRSWQNALARCRGIEGGDLIQIDDATEDAFGNSYRVADTWIGASELGAANQWRWSRDDSQFWQGQSGGMAVGGRYSHWETNEPSGNGDCALLWTAAGAWDDSSCGNSLDYICEVGPDLCPDDPKVAPGVCGCAVPDVDSDGDGVLDCNDECPDDAGTVVQPQCGCPSTPAMLGMACNDGLCAANVACDGAGQCGSLTECIELPTVAAGNNHACALSESGRVICWGDSTYGALGNGDTEDYLRGARHVKGIYDAIQVAVGLDGVHTCALRATGQVLCWGEGANGRLGYGGTANQDAPVAVSGISNAILVTAGMDFSCALLSSGEVRCWGYGGSGRLGRGSSSSSDTPVAVVGGETGDPTLQNVIYLSAGEQHTCALLGDGRAVCWGEGLDGRRCDDHVGNSDVPTYVHGLDNAGTCNAADQSGCLANIQLLDAGEDVTLFIHDGGLVSSCGNDTAGENGQAANGGAGYPRRVSDVGGAGTLDDARWISMGYDHGCAVRDSGEALCWGQDGYGRLGDDGMSAGNQSAPVVVAGSADYAQISAGRDFTCGQHVDGTVRCWGQAGQGQIGDGDYLDREAPTPVAGAPDGFIAIATGKAVGCAVSTSHAVYCWGEANNGELGHGDTRETRAPIRVEGIDNADDVVVGEDSACALLTDGTVNCWGYNALGALGDGTTSQRTTPVAVRVSPGGAVFTGATEITAGEAHVCILRNDGTVWCWGYNAHGELGDGTVANRVNPVPVFGIFDATAVGAGSYHTCAVRGASGQVWCWGDDDLRQLGDDALAANKGLPVPVAGGQTGFAAGRQVIEGGRGHTCAVKADGTLWCWGYNAYGNVGSGTAGGYLDQATKVDSAETDFTRVSCGWSTSGSCALRASGEVLCWGYNDNGELGVESSTGSYATPTRVHFAQAAVTWGNTDLSSPVVDIAVGRDHAMVVHQNGVGSAWGAGGAGRLGSGSIPEWTFPTEISAPPQ